MSSAWSVYDPPYSAGTADVARWERSNGTERFPGLTRLSSSSGTNLGTGAGPSFYLNNNPENLQRMKHHVAATGDA